MANVADTVTPLLEPVVHAQGVELYDVEFVKEGGDRILRLYIDKEGGVDLDDCERVSHAAEAVLDERDPIPASYMLEVSSPGVERKLKKDSHFTRYAGHKVALRLFSPVDGRKIYGGVLAGLTDGVITLTGPNGEAWRFSRAQVASCKLVVFENAR